MHKLLRQRVDESLRLSQGQAAETNGLLAAEAFGDILPFSTDPYIQSRFELGFREGRAILAISEEAL